MAASARASRKLRLLLDEMHAPAIGRVLAEDGWDALAVASEHDLRGRSDSDLMEHAALAGRAIVTENIEDFSVQAAEWVTDGRRFPGLILTNPRRYNRAFRTYPGSLIAALRELHQKPPIDGDSWTWWI